jgi:DNA polymerase-3 subunit gamma/tau
MLSAPAWNALLKLIEEPPPHVVFIMATTEMHKVPATILSRVQQFVFRKITQGELADRLLEICTAEGITAEREALELISARGEGSVRDSLSVLDQIIAFSGRNITAADVINILGLSEDRFLDEVMTLIHRGDHASILERLDEASDNGRDFKLLFKDLLSYVRNLLLVTSGASAKMLGSTGGNPAQLKEIASLFDATELLRILNLLMKDDEIVSRSEHQRLAVELSLLKAATLPRLRSVESVLKGEGGAVVSAPSPRIGASSSERTAPRKSAPAVSEEPAQSSSGSFADDLVRRVSAQRKMTGGNLAQARSIVREGSLVTITFEPTNSFAADSIREGEPLEVVKRAAAEIAGAAVEVKVEMSAPAAPARSEKKANATDDPVLKSFQKHLGGEVVTRSK